MVRQTITHLTQPNPPQQSERASSMNPRIKQDNPSARLSGAGPDRYAHTCRGVCLRDRQTSGDGDRRGGGIGLAGEDILASRGHVSNHGGRSPRSLKKKRGSRVAVRTRVHLFIFFTNPDDHQKRNFGRNSAENRIFRTEGEFKFKKRNSENSGRNSANFRRNSGLSGGKYHFFTTNAPNI